MNSHSKQLAVSLLIVFLASQPAAWGWGSDGHMYVNRVAAERLPQDVPAFLRGAVAELAYLGPEPDRWRDGSDPTLKSAQEPDHYIDLERIAWLDHMPEGRYEFYQKLYEKRAQTKDNPDDYLPERVGLQPYIVMEIFGRLKNSFRNIDSFGIATSRQILSSTRSFSTPGGWVITSRTDRSRSIPPFTTMVGSAQIRKATLLTEAFMLSSRPPMFPQYRRHRLRQFGSRPGTHG